MRVPLMAALEIGTTRTVLCVGEVTKDDRIRVVALAAYPTVGVRKGLIAEVLQARTGVEKVLQKVEELNNLTIRNTLLAISGEHLQSVSHNGAIVLRASGAIISSDDIEHVREIARNMPLDDERLVLHTLEQFFRVDERGGVQNPEGLSGSRLALDVLAIKGLKSHIVDSKNLVKMAHLEVNDVAFGPICSSLSLLSEEQKRNGAIVIDLGGGTTDYLAYGGGMLIAAGSIALGGEHITNDIALAFNMPFGQAESIKCKEGLAVVDSERSTGRIELKRDVGFEELTINRKTLHTVINARVEELLGVVRRRLEEADALPLAGGVVLLSGGGAYLQGMEEMGRRVMGMPCRLGVPLDFDGLEQEEQPAALATITGLVRYGVVTYEEKGVLAWFNNFLRKRS